MAVKFQLRRDTAANWSSANTVLDLGEPGVETDTLKVKVGDGVTPWNSLDYSITREFSELNNIPTTLAGYGITDAATSAQGALADTALQPGDVLEGSFVGDVKGSVYADDSTVMIDGVAATFNLANNSITDFPDADQTLQTTDTVEFGKLITSNIDSSDSSAITFETDVEMLAGLTVGNHILPNSTLNIDLGSATKRFRDIYLSGDTINLGGVEIKRSGSAVQLPAGSLIEGQNPISAPDQDVNTTDDVTFNNITTTGYLAGPATFTIDPAAVGDNTGVVVIAGDLQVDGTTTTINSTTVNVDDLNIQLATGAINAAAADGAGITVDGASANFNYTSSGDRWNFNKNIKVDSAATDILITFEDDSVSNRYQFTTGGNSLDSYFNVNSNSARAAHIRTISGSLNIDIASGFSRNEIRSNGADLQIKDGANIAILVDSGTTDIQFYKDNGGTPQAGLHWDYTDGYLGIGSTTPAYPIDVEGSNQLARFGETAGNNSIRVTRTITNPSSAYLGAYTNSGVIGYTGSAGFKFTNEDTSSDDLVIREDGNVGIGVTNPTAYWAGGQRLVVGTGTGDQGMSILAGTANKSSIAFADGTGTGGYRGRIEYDHATDSFSLGTSGTTPITIDSNNNLGLGAAPNNYADFVTIKLSDTTGGVIEFADDDNVIGEVFNTATDFYVGTTEAGAGVIVRTDTGTVAGTFDSDQNLTVAQNTIANDFILKATEKGLLDNANDVFVYDTRLDSDKGAWRDRTQHTSWYNEALNTATRGSRRKFPAVALLIMNTDGDLLIYDCDDPEMPLWMEFTNKNSSGGADQTTTIDYYAAGPYESKTVVAKNGVLVTAQLRSAGHITGIVKGVTRFKMIEDASYMMTDEGDFRRNGNLGDQRNSVAKYTKVSTNSLPHSQCFDLTIDVFPNAAIDSVTGLPIPTIGVGTLDGLYIIRDDNSVVGITQAHGGDTTIENIAFDIVTGAVLFTTDYNNSGQAYKLNASPIPSSVVTENSQVENGFQDWYFQIQSGGNTTIPHLINVDTNTETTDINAFISTGEGEYAVAEGQGLDLIQESRDGLDQSMIAYIASDYNTGWMLGDIKLCTMADTETGTVIGSELVTNGDFGTGDFTGWTISGDVTPTISSGGALLTTSVTVDGTIEQSISGSSSGINTISWTVISNSGGQFGLYINGGLVHTFTTTGSYTYNGSISSLKITHRVASSGIIDDISIRVAEDDRSLNRNGVQVFGGISKSVVGTGSDLVVYSGWDNSNYMVQPYNPDLPTGATDPWTVLVWAKVSANPGNTNVLFQFGTNLTGELRQFNMTTSGEWYFARNGSNTSGTSVTNLGDNAWHLLGATHDGSGNVSIYVDGEFQSTTAFTLNSASGTDPLYIGNDYDGGNAFTNGELALLRISKTQATNAQMEKIYNDEKVLFASQAKATLYGTSNLVTAIAFDRETKLLHAGTSDGRSVFQGLRRIDNTTDAVSVAISAANGLVAEE